jgi:ribosome hibernation promoting factor
MQVQITGKQMDVGDALRERITESLNASVGKYFERGGSAEVVVSQGSYDFRVDCRLFLASGQFLESHGLAGDAHAAFDVALEKIETRVRRYKRRLKNHHNGPRQPVESTAVFVLRSPDEETDQDGWDELSEQGLVSHEPPSGVIIAETETEVKTLTVSMAVMELDLSGSQTIVFRNAAHGGVSVVYRRPDGNIGWVDPDRAKALSSAAA